MCPGACEFVFYNNTFLALKIKEDLIKNGTSEMKDLKCSYRKSPGHGVRGAGCGPRDSGALVLRTHVRDKAMKGETKWA